LPSTDNFLADVWCSSSTVCTAVGHVARAFDDGGPETRTLIEENTGAGWRIVPSPNDDASVGSKLRAITCINAGNCIAVGDSANRASIPKTLIEQDNGSGWTIIPSPNPSVIGGFARLAGVACATSTHCVAVGSYESDGGNFHTLIEENHGNGWQVVPSPNPGADSDDRLNAVACASQSLCVAVGAHHSGEHDLPLVEQNSGAGWTIVAVPGSGGLEGVACPGPAACVATGGEESVSGTSLFIDHLVEDMTNGVWTTVSVPGLAGTLHRVSCSSATYCIAVSSWGTSSAGGSPIIAERINNVWAAGAQAPVANELLDLVGVACPSARSCIAVGDRILGKDVDYMRPRATFICRAHNPRMDGPDQPQRLRF